MQLLVFLNIDEIFSPNFCAYCLVSFQIILQNTVICASKGLSTTFEGSSIMLHITRETPTLNFINWKSPDSNLPSVDSGNSYKRSPGWKINVGGSFAASRTSLLVSLPYERSRELAPIHTLRNNKQYFIPLKWADFNLWQTV